MLTAILILGAAAWVFGIGYTVAKERYERGVSWPEQTEKERIIAETKMAMERYREDYGDD